MKTAKAIQPFDKTLRDINAGRLVDELTDAVTDIIAAVRKTGKAGEIRLSLKFKPRGECNSQIEVVPTIKAIEPEAPRRVAIFFANDDDGLQRDDPRQGQLPGLVVADSSTTPQEAKSQ